MKGSSKFVVIVSIISFSLITSPAFSQAKKGQGKWWKETVFYEIYMPSYADSNGDGYGDFKGMTAKLDYLQSLGVRGSGLHRSCNLPKLTTGMMLQVTMISTQPTAAQLISKII